MKILFIGDVVGRLGRNAIKTLLPELVREFELDFVIANGENSAGGMGISPESVEELLQAGVQVLTNGNHVWKNRQAYDIIKTEARLLRPANYPVGAPGRGSAIFQPEGGPAIGILNLIGRVFMDDLDCPFQVAAKELERLGQEAKVIVVDIHAEATSEKVAMGWYLDGKVSAVLGTHTHIQTSDERILPKGTAYITDVGMTGPRDSILGVEPEKIVERFLTRLPNRFEVAGGVAQLDAVVVDIDTETGKANKIERIRRFSSPS